MVNLFAAIPEKLPAELTDILVDSSTTRIERIVSTGQVSPPGFWYEQEEAEWVLLLQGAAVVTVEDQADVSLGPGDHLFLPARCRHRVAWTSLKEQTIWLAVFMKPST